MLGAGLAITATITIAYFVGSDASGSESSDNTIYVVIPRAAAVGRGSHLSHPQDRRTAEKWMGELQSSTPKRSFRLGFLLLGAFPGDILTSIAVGAYLSTRGDPWWHVLPFVALTLLLLGLPAILVLALGQRAQTLLPKVRDWMNDNSWVISEVVLLFFILITINSLSS